MRHILIIISIFLFSLTIYSCSSSSDDGASTTSDNTTTTSDDDSTTTTDNTTTTDTTAPVISGSTIPTPTNDNTPDFIITSSEAGTITYYGPCASSTTSAIAGSITVTFNTLSDGIHSCAFWVTDSAGNVSIAWAINSFMVDTTAPVIAEVTAVTTPTREFTQNYTFTSDAAGTITYGGSCSSSTTSATPDNNTITFAALLDGFTYSDCTITVTDSAENVSNILEITSFTVDTNPGVFVAVGTSGNIVRSTDNGSSWDNTTSPTANFLWGVGFGNNTFVGVGLNGNIVRSTDNGSSWDNVTSPTSERHIGVTFGNDTFVGVGLNGNIVRSTDNGSSWDNATSPTANNLLGVTFGNNTFVGVGVSGNIVRSTDNGASFDNVTSPTANHLTRVTFGNNTFVAVGYSGNILRSTNNGSSWDNTTSPTSNNLWGVTFGNNTFVGVGASGNIVRSIDNGSSWDNASSPTTTNLNGVTFGNNNLLTMVRLGIMQLLRLQIISGVSHSKNNH